MIPASRITVTIGITLLLGGILLLIFDRSPSEVHRSAVAALPSALPSAGAATSTLRVLFVGDMFFDRYIRQVSAQFGPDYPFICIDPLFQSADVVVGNLEGPITDSTSISFGTIPGSANNYTFTFPTTTAAALARHRVRAVSLGNNHILNFSWSGLLSTQQYLSAAGVGYFGGAAGNEPIYRIDANGVHLSLVGFNSFGGSSAQSVASTTATERAKGREVVVFAHWGVEYATTTATTRPIAQLFADSGATAVIGSHPHVVGPHEWLSNTLVYYSLGNFIFDQYFSSAVVHGLAVMITFSPQGIVNAQEYPVELERSGQTCLDK